MSSLSSLPAASALDRLSQILIGLTAWVIGRSATPEMGHALCQMICLRLTKVGTDLRAIAAALAAGTLRVRRSPAPGLTRRPAATPALRLPRKFGWLLPLMQPTAAIYGGYVRALLEDPEMAALLAASPRAVRAIRPLCRMLGVTMPAVAEPIAAAGDVVPAEVARDRAGVAPAARAIGGDAPCAFSPSFGRDDEDGCRKISVL